METINLSNETVFKVDLCLFCQNDGNLVSTQNGRDTIIDASRYRNDEITRRLETIGDNIFYYHVGNDCYKRYTNKTLLSRIQRKRKAEEESNTDNSDHLSTPSTSVHLRRSLRGESRPPPNPKSATSFLLYKQKCMICDKLSHKKDFQKFRISESSRATSFLNATVFFQDEVFTRTCDLQDEHAVFGADLFYHKLCIQNYIQMFKNQSKDQRDTQTLSNKQRICNDMLVMIENGLMNVKGYELSVIRDHLNSQLSKEDALCLNRDVKVLLINHFDERIDFAYPDSSRKCMMVFGVNKNQANVLAETIRSINPFQVCASVIRRELSNYDFDLTDRFCDAEDLRKSISNFNIPDVTLQFWGEVFNFDMDSYYEAAKKVTPGSNDDESEEEVEEVRKTSRNLSKQRCRKIQALFQTMFYIFHCGRQKTPMHIMNAVWAQSLGNGGSIFTKILNHEGLAISYTELLRYQHDLAAFSLQNQDERVQMPSHFQADQFTSGAIDNWDHEGEKTSVHDTVAVLYQDRSQVKSFKPKLSEVAMSHGPRALNNILRCQELLEFYKPSHHPDFPKNGTIEPNVHVYDNIANILKKDMIWSLIRLDIESIISAIFKNV